MISADVSLASMQQQRARRIFLFFARVLPVLSVVVFIASLSFVLIVPTEAVAARKGGTVYRWVDSDGNVRYSDRIPPDQADLGHSEIARSTGITQREVPRAKTAEQLAREMTEAQEKRRLEQIEKAQKEEERSLLRRYRDLNAIDYDMNIQLERADAEMRTINARIDSVRLAIADLHKRAANIERNQSSPPLDLYSRMDELDKEVIEHESALSAKQDSRKEIEAQFADYRAQFIRIMGLPSPS